MILASYFADASGDENSEARRLQNFHKRNYSLVLWGILAALVVFIVWSSYFVIDETARASGQVIASSGVQIIQSVDGGVVSSINVKEGDRVAPGQILATLDQTRFGASVKEIEARLAALQAKAIRLRAEVTGASTLSFGSELDDYDNAVAVEQALFDQRKSGLQQELENLRKAAALAGEEVGLVRELSRSGDVNRSEIIRAEQALNNAESRLIVRRNEYLEEASTELTRVEDQIAQNVQVLTQRREQLEASVFKALVPGIVKNIRVTTIGGVLRPGEEMMQIIPTGDELIVEAKVRPTDIALIQPGLSAMVRYDPFDFTIYGAMVGEVIYVSADTLKETSGSREEIYYLVHVAPASLPVTTTTGKRLEILPGMTAQVDIRTGERTVLEFLLKPIRKTLNQAFGER